MAGRPSDPGDKPIRFEETTQVTRIDDSRPAAAMRRDRAMLTVLVGPNPGAIMTVEADPIVLGRGQEATYRLEDEGLSRAHARVVREGEQFFVEDLGSTNGTFVNGYRITQKRPLRDGDRIQVGKNTILKFNHQDALEQDAVRQLYESAVRDPLTHVYNRRYLEERLRQEFAYAARHGTSLSVLILDIDHFKRINDTLGHLAGDRVIQVLADTVARIVRAEDVVARYGGEEFAVIARGIQAAHAVIFAERIRHSIERLAIPWEGQSLQITVSVGVATMDRDVTFRDMRAVVTAADDALYRAKNGGRNRVEKA